MSTAYEIWDRAIDHFAAKEETRGEEVRPHILRLLIQARTDFNPARRKVFMDELAIFITSALREGVLTKEEAISATPSGVEIPEDLVHELLDACVKEANLSLGTDDGEASLAFWRMISENSEGILSPCMSAQFPALTSEDLIWLLLRDAQTSITGEEPDRRLASIGSTLGAAVNFVRAKGLISDDDPVFIPHNVPLGERETAQALSAEMALRDSGHTAPTAQA